MKPFIRYTLSLLIAAACAGLYSCQGPSAADEAAAATVTASAPEQTLFTLLSADKTNVRFQNNLTENPYGNILLYQYFYNGGGVAIGDINNDGLQDIYFTGNMSQNRLYLNKGNMQFEDITEAAGVGGRANHWATGVTMADVNGDGLLDIYVCYSGHMPDEARVNQLFINQGSDGEELPRFLEQADAYGLNDAGYSTNATFFDYDLDGDLDMFLLNHNPFIFNNLDELSISQILKKPEPMMRVKLYRNDNGRFQDVTDKAGFAGSGLTYGLGAGIADINNDGLPDIYVSNDYSAPDYLYLNNGDGTFTDKLKQDIRHTSLYSMGNDIADINNDGLPEIYTLDMLPEDNRRQKLLFSPDNYERFNMQVRGGLHYQYMRNMLQVNNGDGTFSEVGQLSGISNTDWSWAPLFADYDNDGWKDLFVSNGFLKDFTNMDFIKFYSNVRQNPSTRPRPEQLMQLLEKMPASNVSNYIYKNNGNFNFENKGTAWGFNMPSNSNGAAYADLDNDGDLDLVTNNLNQPAFIYQNNADKQLNHQYLQVKLEGAGKNTAGIGAKVTVYANGAQQYQEQMPVRGYQSSVSPVLHFGLGDNKTLDSVRVVWPNKKQQVLQQVAANQVLTLQQENAVTNYRYTKPASARYAAVASPVAFTHQKNTINDFKRQPLLISPISFSGPCLVKADVNGDGLEDVFVGGGAGQAGAVYLQQKNGSFQLKATAALEADKMSEDTDALFFDANQDGNPDLYVSSGGYGNFRMDDVLLQDRLYLNDGKGNFTKTADALPAMRTSTSCARAADVNGDGHLDLFVGSRVIPGRYPEAPQSYLLLNDGTGKFTDATATVAPQLQRIGMVTDAAFHDLNGDKQLELVVVGEWMPVTVFSNSKGKLGNTTDTYFNGTYSGWWNKLLVADLNQDGKPDLVIGNHGLNAQVKASAAQPAELYYKDFDDNGSVDPILCFYVKGTSYPYVTRDELLDQISMMRTRFPTYESYADATLQDVFKKEELQGAGLLKATHLKTMYFESSASGKYTEKELPLQAQYAPVHAITVFDYNQDGKPDLMLAGNVNQARLRFGKFDANYGVVLQGDGSGNFSYVPQHQSGFQLKGDVRSVVAVNNTLLFGMNQQEVRAYKPRKP